MDLTRGLKWFTFICVWLVSHYANNVSAANILALCAMPSPSHSLWCYRYLAALSERGHQITVFGVDEPKFQIANLTKFIANHVYDTVYGDGEVGRNFVGENLPKLQNIHTAYSHFNEASTKALLRSPELQELIRKYKGVKKPFDLIIHDNAVADALLGLVPLFGNPPLVVATTFNSPQWMTSRAGNIFNPAYVPSMVTSGGQHMTFYERLVNTYYYIYIEWVCEWIMDPIQDQVMREVFGKGLPRAKDLAKRAGVVIVNHHPVMHDPRPMLPGVIGISGLHVADPRPLPKDIKEFMDGAKDGVVLLSFGTNVQPDWLPDGFEKMVVKALGQLPQRVLWRWSNDIPDLPPNVIVRKWLPQSDMMAHPKMRLFASHCGLLSTQEAFHRNMLILALPVFLDQLDNADMLVRYNLTIRLNVFRLTSDELRDSITEMLSNPMYKRNMDRMSKLVLDTPLTPSQMAVYWTEYAIRHQGAAHLRPASADMPWYQLLLLDVVAVMLALALTVVWFIKTIFVFIIRAVWPSSSKVKSRRKQE